jgi:hypothetical protein
VLAQGRVPYQASTALAALARRRFAALLAGGRLAAIQPHRQLAHELVTFAGATSHLELIACLRSYQRQVGRPARVLVASDGSLTHAMIDTVSRECDTAEVVAWSELAGSIPAELDRYAHQHPLGAKLAVLRVIGMGAPVLFTDTDVLFFGQAHVIPELLSAGVGRYMADCTPHGGDRRLVTSWTREDSLNSGFLVITPEMDWEYGIGLLDGLDGPPEWNTEQTICRLVFARAGARPLDPYRFVVSVADKWRLTDDARPFAGCAARHYIGPVRNKFWQRVLVEERLLGRASSSVQS